MNNWGEWVTVTIYEKDRQHIHLITKETAEHYFEDYNRPTKEEMFLYKLGCDVKQASEFIGGGTRPFTPSHKIYDSLPASAFSKLNNNNKQKGK